MKSNYFSQKRAASLFQRVLSLEAEYLVVDRQTQTGLSNCSIVKTASSTVSVIALEGAMIQEFSLLN